MEELFKLAAGFGISGLFFIMWVLERKDRVATLDFARSIEALGKESTRRESDFTKIVINNTEALTRLTGLIQHEGVQHAKSKNNSGTSYRPSA